MLQARLADGRLITPAAISKRKRKELKLKNLVFYCPVCNEKVILRAGEKVIAHFAHQSQSNCPSTSGGEGAYHEQGKLLLYQWLRSQQIDVELEVYIQEIKQRPDFLVKLNGKMIAIEYQCSKIPNKQIIERTNGYQQAGIHVIWILGEKLLKRKTKDIIKIDTFSQTLIHQFSSTYPPSLFYFCPQTLNLIKIQDIFVFGNSRAAGKVKVFPLRNMTVVDLFSQQFFMEKELSEIWRKEKLHFRLKTRERLFGTELQWQQWLYLKRLHYEKLPAIIHLPVKTAYLLNVESWNWQSRIVFDLINPLKIGEEFSVYQCIRLLRKYIRSKENFPLIKTELYPIQEYLHVLAHLQYLEQTSMNTFKKIKSIHVHQHVEQAIEEDEQLIKQVFTKNQTKYEHVRVIFRYTK